MFLGTGRRGGEARRSGADFFTDYLSPFIVLVWILFWAASGTLQAQSAEELPVLGRIPTDRVIDQIALAPGSRIAYGLSHLAGALYVFDLETYQIRKKIDLGRPPVGLAVDPGNGLAYVIAGSEFRFGTGGLLWTINPEGLIQNSVALTETPQDLALNSETDRLIVSAEKERKLLIFSLSTLEKINEVPLPFGPRALALDPDSGRAVVTVGETLGGGDTDRVVVLDLETGTILAETDLAGGVTGVAVAGEKDLALLLSGDKLYLFDINQAFPPSLLPEGPAPYKKVAAKNSRLRGNRYFGLEVNQATQRGIVSGQGCLVLVDLDNRTLRRFSRTDIAEIRAVAVDPLRNILWGSYWGAGASRRVEKGLMEMQLPNPRPELLELRPAEVLRGGANQSVAVTGRGFLVSSELYLGDQPLDRLFLDDHHLQLPLPPEAIARAGLLPLSVVNPAPEGGRSNNLGLLVKNPVPALTGLDPVAVPAGHAGLTLEVFGSGFQDDTSPLWDGLARPGSLVNAERIQVALTAADLETAALRTVAVSNPGPGGGQSNTILFSIQNPEPLLFRLSPQAASAGAPGFPLELTGSGLVRASQVWFDHYPLETAYVDGGRLTALIPETLIQTPGLFPVRVVNPGPGGGSSGTLDFLVSAVALLPDGSFGKKYEDLVPADADLPAYDPWRFSLITGLVKEGSGNGLAGVEVTILGRPEYGTAFSGSDGRFSLPADGGETFVIRLRKAGFLEAQRRVAAGWNTVDAIENVVLIPQDLTATTLRFDGNPTTFSTHTATMVSDERGERSLTLVFSGDNRAVVRDDQGLEQPLESFTVRATEYPGPEAMPARLPPNSAFTYCAELAVDGAAQVYFDKPVTVWVDNFLGFEVGEIVPVGYYDRERGLWVPGENGRVVRLLDTNEDGVVDAYEDGRGAFPAPGLTDRSRFVPNSTFWRLEVSHFTPWDCNWPYGPPPGAIAPNPAGPPVITRAEPDRELTCINSYVEDRGGVFHEDLPLPGTDFFLHYASDRTPGYKPRITIPASGAAVPAELLRILVRMELAGRTFEAVLPARANQQTEFIWDGLDHLGRQVTGSAQARIRIGFEYPTVYYSGSSIYGQAFAQPGTSATWVAARENIIAWQESRLTIERGAGDLARGWTLSVHQRLHPSEPGTLHKGDGTTLRNNVRLIATVAAARPVGDGTSALRGIALDRSGNIFFSDPYNYRYMRAEPGGEITYYSTFNTPLGIYRAYGLGMDGAGNLYLACPDAYAGGVIVKIDPSGGQAIIAGNRQKGFSGDDGPATAASLNWPEDLALDASGNIYIADTQNNRIRKIDPRGIITTVAGSGVRGFGGDGGSALEARLAAPRGVAVDPQGNLYIADTDNHRIRKVDAAGRISTLAGSGTWGFGGDGGPAAEALLYGPVGLALDGAGQLYLADQFNNRIRRVDSGGIISTVAGNGDQGNDNGEGGPAVQATVHLPAGVALDSAGNVYGVVSDYGKVKRIAFPGAFQAQGLTGDTVFAEANGRGYILDSVGIHRTTYDLPTGKTLLTFDHDQAHQLTSVADRFGNRTTIQRDGSGRPLSLTAPDGQVTRLTVDGDRHLTGLVYPDGSVYAFTYTPEGLLTVKTDPRGRPFTNQYEAGGLIAGAEDPEGGSWQYARAVDHNGEVSVTKQTAEGDTTLYRERTAWSGIYRAERRDPWGAGWTLTRSADELTETEQPACGLGVTRQYDLDPVFRYRYVREATETTPTGLLRQQGLTLSYQDTNADRTLDRISRTRTLNGANWLRVQDTLAGLITDHSPLGRTVIRAYDPDHLLTRSLTVGGLLPWEYHYDQRGRLTSLTVGERILSLGYDSQGHIEQIVTPDQKLLRYTYDPMGRIVTLSRPDNTLIRFQYDPNGNLTVLTGPQGVHYGFDYTGVNGRQSLIQPLSGSYRYSYDRDRRLTSLRFPSGREIVNTYFQGLPAETATPEGRTRFSYGCGSLLSGVTRNGEQLAYGYDGGFLTADTRSGLLNQGIAYVYNNDFRVAAISYAGGTEALTYDADGLLTGAGGFTITRSAQNGLPEGVTDGTLAATRTFNGFGEAAGVAYQVGGAPRYSYTLSRDPAGRITRKVETFAGVGVTLDYTYDANGRLRETRKDGLLVEVYGYDVNGNRIQETNTFKGLVNQPHTHSVEDHLLTAGAVSYQFDVDGFINRKTNGAAVTGYQYSSRGELLRVDLPGGAIIEFVHDPLGRRIAKKKNGVIVEKYLWRDATSLLAVYDGADSLSQRFLYAEDRVPVAMTRNGQTYYLLYDQLGSLRAVVDAAGAVVKRVDYDSYGYIISDSAPEFSVPFGFAGGLHDPDVGLIRFGARDYDPLIGRWTAKDPIDFGGGDTNLFGYVGGDPVRKIDPLGLVAELCTRIFFPYVIPYARHCFIRFNGNNFDTLSFDPSGVHQDPAPNWWPRSCQQTLGPQDDDCVKKEMQKCRGDQYSFLGFNCCHCAEQALKGCGLGLPSNGWPNWPINPGPQPGEMGYRP